MSTQLTGVPQCRHLTSRCAPQRPQNASRSLKSAPHLGQPVIACSRAASRERHDTVRRFPDSGAAAQGHFERIFERRSAQLQNVAQLTSYDTEPFVNSECPADSLPPARPSIAGESVTGGRRELRQCFGRHAWRSRDRSVNLSAHDWHPYVSQ